MAKGNVLYARGANESSWRVVARFEDRDLRNANAYVVSPNGDKLVLTSPKAPLEELRFADLDGDNDNDVFFVDITGGKWLVWKEGTNDWTELNSSSGIMGIPVTDLAFGQFDTNPGADVFRSDAVNGAWYYSSGGQSGWNSLGAFHPSRKIPTSELRIGDFDGDKTSDVFQSDIPVQTWRWSRSGLGPWLPLLNHVETAVPVHDFLFGDFDGDQITDVLKPTGIAWGVSWKGAATPVLLKLSCDKVKDVALGDFDGDGTTVVIRAGIRP